MSKRVLGVAMALLMAAIGTVALVAYVQGAEERARAGEELVEVYVVDISIPAGTAGDELANRVRVEEVPVKVQAEGAIDSLQALAGQVAAVELVPGEQLVAARFIRRTEFANRAVGVIVPDGMLEVTIRVDPDRVIGGLIEPGETVAVIGSFDPFTIEANTVEVEGEEVAVPDAAAEDQKTPNTTGILMHKVLVTAIQRSTNNSFDSEEEENNSRLDNAPSGDFLITLALSPGDAERLVFTSEFGRLYLASEREDVPETETPIQTRASVYDPVDVDQ